MFSLESTNHIPNDPGVYFFKDLKGKILYIGKAKNLKKRLQQYFVHGSVWKQDMLMQASSLDFTVTQSESESLYLEDNMIKKHQPVFNRLLKADNSYVYIKITHHPFPQIFVTHYRQADQAIYIGPKHYRSELSKLLHYLRQIFHRRACRAKQFNQGVLCNDYIFGLCKGRCVYDKIKDVDPKNLQDNIYVQKASALGLSVSNNLIQPIVIESQDMIQQLQQFFDGDDSKIKKTIIGQIQQCIQEQNFEYAHILKEIHNHIALFVEKQIVVIDDEKITGYRYLIQEIQDQYLVCILKCRKGKIIDIIRFHQPKEDEDTDSIQNKLSREFDEISWTYHDTNYRMGSSLTKTTSQKHYRNIYQFIEKSLDGYVYAQSYQNNDLIGKILQSLQDKYQLSHYPYRIECIDISHLGGEYTSGAISCMQSGILRKKGYRQYKILEATNDDYRSMLEVLTRRLYKKDDDKKGASVLPDLVILDGGIGQLHIINKLLSDHHISIGTIQFVALGKGKARKRASKNDGNVEILFVRRDDGTIDSYPLQYDEIDRLLIKLRDEAHRFANRYRVNQMKQKRSQ